MSSGGAPGGAAPFTRGRAPSPGARWARSQGLAKGASQAPGASRRSILSRTEKGTRAAPRPSNNRGGEALAARPQLCLGARKWSFEPWYVIYAIMNAKLQNLLERIAALPDELLGEVEESVDEIERWRDDVFRLTEDERAAVRKGMDAARRGEFVTDEELAAFYRLHGG